MRVSCLDSRDQRKKYDLESRVWKKCFLFITENAIATFQTTLDAQEPMLVISAENLEKIRWEYL